VAVGVTATFTVNFTGTAPCTYQWLENGVVIPGAMSAVFTTPVLAASDNGEQYSVTVTDSAGFVTSAAAVLTVNAVGSSAPVITTQPTSQSVAIGTKATFTVNFTGEAPFTYQWFENGVAIQGATSAFFTTPVLAATDNGIEIPLGSYLPRFHHPLKSSGEGVADGTQHCPAAGNQQEDGREDYREDPPVALPPVVVSAPLASETRPATPGGSWFPAAQLSRGRLHLAAVYFVLLAVLFAWGISEWRESLRAQLTPGVALFWEKILHSPEPTMIVLGVHSIDAKGNDNSPLSHASQPRPQETLLAAMTRSDMVHLSDLTGYGEIVRLLTGHTHSFRTQGAADTTLEQLRQGSFVLIGGFNNLWTKRLSQELRFRLVTLNGHDNVIQDSQHPSTVWTLDVTRSALANSRDYGLVSCFFDPETEQHVILAAGIGKSGTEAATDFLTNEPGLDAWFKTIHPRSGANVEVVVSTDVIEGEHGPPHVVSYSIW
jgi:hypothetical protein